MATNTFLIFIFGSMLSFFVAMWCLFRPRLRERNTSPNPVLELRISVGPDVRIESVRATGLMLARPPTGGSRTHGAPPMCTVDPVGLTEQLDALILTAATEFADRREVWPALPAE